MRGWPPSLAPPDCALEGSPRCPTARSKALPDDQLVPEESVLHTGLLMVARVLLPLSPSSLLHLSDRAVARGRSWSPSRHGGCPGRWNDDRRATRTRSLVDATRVVGRVRREAGDVAFDLVDQIEGRRRVVNMPAGQGVSDDHARSVDAQMKLLPVGLEFRIRSLNRGLGHHCVAPEF